jgi:dephospho-CoA kinase
VAPAGRAGEDAAVPSGPERPPAARRAFRPDPPVVIGLLGGIAAGKSAVAAAFAARGLQVVDADAIARSVTDDPGVVRQVAAALGAGVAPDGRLDRAAVAAVVFADPAARKRLEAITHPRIRERILAALAAARACGDSVLLDAPLLLEGGLIERCDHVVFVAASDAVRAARAAARGWSAAELARREAAQHPLAQKRARAQFVVDNDGPLDATHRQVDDLLDRWLPA